MQRGTLMKKKILSDVVFNIAASLIPMFALQFIILPLIASRVDSNIYGQLLSLVAFMNLSGGTLGNILNNSKLINYKKYHELKINGDYTIYTRIFLILNFLLMIFGIWFYGNSLDTIGVVTLIIASLLLLIKGYARVEFRLNLNFKNILLESIFLLIGYLIGLLLFLFSGYWQFIYLCGFASSITFIYKKTNILKEPPVKTSLFKQTSNQIITLLISGLLLSLGTYVDKLLLYPLLGGLAVSIYYTATILGKSISLLIQPITGVLLSYFAQLKRFDVKNFYVLFGISIIIGSVGYGIIVLVSEPLLKLLYPKYVDEAMKYIYITTLSTIIIIITNIINSVVLKFCNVKWQFIINGIYMLAYILTSTILLKQYGLMGFCNGILIASIVKLVVMLFAYYLNNKQYEVTKVDI